MASKSHRVHLVFWDRCAGRGSAIPSGIDDSVALWPIEIHAPFGGRLRRIGPLIRFIPRAMYSLRCICPDIIHCGGMDMLLIAALYGRVSRKAVRIIYEVGDLEPITYGDPEGISEVLARPLLRKLERSLCRAVSLLIVTSPAFWTEYYRMMIPQGRTLFIPNAPEPGPFEGYRRSAHTGFCVGFIGSVRYPQQLKMLIDVVQEMPGVRVLIAGDGTSQAEIADYCRGKDRVDVRGRYDYLVDIARLYGEIDFTYAVYDTGSANVRVALPNRLYESIVCETPILCASGTVLGDFVVEHGIGVAVNANNREELREALHMLTTDGVLVQQMRERMRNLRLTSCSHSGENSLEQAYERILGAV